MKRAHNKTEKKKPDYALVGWTGPVLPTELIQEIAYHYRPQNVLEIFNFIRICKSAVAALPLIMIPWLTTLFKDIKPTGQVVVFANTELHTLVHYIRQHRGDLSDLLDAMAHLPTAPSKELAVIFELQTQAMIDLHMLHMNKSVTSQNMYHGSEICRIAGRSTKLRIGDIYYYNEAKKEVIRLKDLPGLRTVEVIGKSKAIVKEAEAIVDRRQENGTIFDELALYGFEGIKTTDLHMRAVHYELMKADGRPLPTHKPHKKSLLCNVIVNEKHLYSESHRELRGNLFTCYVDRRKPKPDQKSYPECSKEFLVLQHCTASDRFRDTWKKIGLKHGYDSDSSLSDYTSDSESSSSAL